MYNNVEIVEFHTKITNSYAASAADTAASVVMLPKSATTLNSSLQVLLPSALE